MIVSRSVISRTTLFVATLCIASIAMADVDNEANNNIVTEPAREVQAEVKSIDVVSASLNKDTASVDAASVASTEVQTSDVVESKVTIAAEIEHEVAADVKLVGSVPVVETIEERATVSVTEQVSEAVEQHVDAVQILEVPPASVVTLSEPVLEKPVDILSVLEGDLEISGEVLSIDGAVVADNKINVVTESVQASENKAHAAETVVPTDVQQTDAASVSDSEVNVVVESQPVIENKAEPVVPTEIQQTDAIPVIDNKVAVVTEPATAAENKAIVSETTVPTDIQQIDVQLVMADEAVHSDEPAADQKVDGQQGQEISTDLKNDRSWFQWLQTPEGKKYGIGAIAVITVLGVTYVLYKNRVPQRIYGYAVRNPIKSLVSTACVLGIAAFVAHQQGVTLDAIKDKICFPVQP